VVGGGGGGGGGGVSGCMNFFRPSACAGILLRNFKGIFLCFPSLHEFVSFTFLSANFFVFPHLPPSFF
jgi:hypothetical protein